MSKLPLAIYRRNLDYKWIWYIINHVKLIEICDRNYLSDWNKPCIIKCIPTGNIELLQGH